MAESVKLCIYCKYNSHLGKWCEMYELSKKEARKQCKGTYWQRTRSGYFAKMLDKGC